MKTNDMVDGNLQLLVNKSEVAGSTETKGDHITNNGSMISSTKPSGFESNKKRRNANSMIFTTSSIPENARFFYFEVTVEDEGDTKIVCIGLTKADPNYKNGRSPGWDPGTIGYHGDDGGIFHETGGSNKIAQQPFGSEDTVGCMFIHEKDNEDGSLFLCYFTKNGKYLDTVKVLEKDDYHPTIGMNSPGAKVITNMGEKDFRYKIPGQYMGFAIDIIDSYSYKKLCYFDF